MIRTLNGLSSNTININTITPVEPLLLTGNAISIKGLSGFTANKLLKVNSAGTAIEYADDNDTNYWTYSTPSLYPINTTDNLLLGTTSNSDTRKLLVNGTSEFQGVIYSKGGVGDSGYINLYDTDKSHHTSLIPSENVSVDITLPATTDTLIGKTTVDILQSKTFNNFNNTINKFTGNSSSEITAPSSTGTLCLTTGSSSIATVGTITTGTWNGTRLGKDYIPTDTVYDADISSFITASSTDTLTNKTVGDFTTFNEGLGIKYNAFSGVSGFLRLYDDDATNFMDVHIEGHSLTSNMSVFLPKGVDETILVGKDTTDTLTNKTLTGGSNSIVSFSGNSGSVITTPSITGTLAVVSQIHDEHSYNTPLTLSSGSVSLGNLNGYGSNNQILTTNGTDTLVYKTLTQGSNMTIVNTGTTITFDTSVNYWTRGSSLTTVDIKPISNVDEIDFLDTILFGNQPTYFGSSFGSIKEIYAEKLKCPFTYAQVLTLYDDAVGTNTTSIIATDSGIQTTRDKILSYNDNNSYIEWVSYSSQRPLLLHNALSSGGEAYHILFKHSSTGTGTFPIIKQNSSAELIIHYDNVGDRFKVSKDWDFGHAHAQFNYTSPFTHFYDPSAEDGGSASLAGSYFTFHNNGSAIYFNTTSTYNDGSGAGNTNYFSFAKSNDQQARITMDGIAQIADEWTDGSDPSDIRIKYDIKDYGNATEVINKIKIKSFMKYQMKNFNNDTQGKLLPFKDRLGEAKYSIGVIAQELYEIPELSFMVKQSDFNDTTPAYIHDWKPIISLLVKSNQEQQQQIDTLTNLVNQQQVIIDKLTKSKSFKEFISS